MARGPLNQQEVEQYRQDGVVLCRLAGSRQGHQRLEPPFGGAGFSLSIRAKLGLIFLKVKLQRQLNLAHGGRCRGNLTESRYRRRTRTAPQLMLVGLDSSTWLGALNIS